MKRIISRIAQELAVDTQQVSAAVMLLDEGSTVPFIARYRKERTQGLDDAQLRQLESRLEYLRELETRRDQILKIIREQGNLTTELEHQIVQAESKIRLEDLYLPYRPKRRSKAQIAREAGLEPLALSLLNDPILPPESEAKAYIDPGRDVDDVAAALAGARQILMERFTENAALVGELRAYLWEEGKMVSTLIAGKESEAGKFRDYFEYSEPLKQIPSHRALALFRGRDEGVLKLELIVQDDPSVGNVCESRIAQRVGIRQQGRPADNWLYKTVQWAWRIKIFTHLEVELKMRLKEQAEAEAISVFGRNIGDLLLSPPARGMTIMGLDPGLRTGVKVAVVDGTGKVLDTATIYPHAPQKKWDHALSKLAVLAAKHKVQLISIGNGTASRETDRLATELIRQHEQLALTKMMVSEAGASVYSASELASAELPELDVTLRGAVSIARRVQDPLAELVKIEPKAIGVGQYQHDVNQGKLGKALDSVVEDCVNRVGVDVNTASMALLCRVAGLSRTQASNIVRFRNEHGAFATRKQLLEVPRIGARSYEQAAGFLRINDGDNPLDSSAVHPEAYPVVERILAHAGRSAEALIGDSSYLRDLQPTQFIDERFGLPTISDIISELDKPGRDPRGEFRTASFTDGVETLADLKPDMVLEGVVTNVTNFGAFIDIGVHQDGLVHISAMSDKFVRDPRELVKAGDLVKVKIIGIEIDRKRIALSMRLADRADAGERRPVPSIAKSPPTKARGSRSEMKNPAKPQSAMAAALASAIKRK